MGWKGVSFGLCDFPAAAEKALHSKTWLEHCMLRRSGVHYRPAGKIKTEIPGHTPQEIGRMLMHKCARYTTKFLILCAAVVAMTLAGSVPAAAQYTTGSLGGTVVDQTGALVPGAKLTVQNADTSFTQSVSTGDRKSTRLNSSHGYISYAVFCLKKKKKQKERSEQI